MSRLDIEEHVLQALADLVEKRARSNHDRECVRFTASVMNACVENEISALAQVIEKLLDENNR